MSRQDTVDFIAFLIRQYESRFVLAEATTNELPVYSDASSINEVLASEHSTRFFVVSPKWQRHPLIVDKESVARPVGLVLGFSLAPSRLMPKGHGCVRETGISNRTRKSQPESPGYLALRSEPDFRRLAGTRE